MRFIRLLLALGGLATANHLVARDACSDTCTERDYAIGIYAKSSDPSKSQSEIDTADFGTIKATSSDGGTNLCGDYRDGDEHMDETWTVTCDDNGVPNGFSGPEGEGSCWAPLGDTLCQKPGINHEIKACCSIGPTPVVPPPPPPPPDDDPPPPEGPSNTAIPPGFEPAPCTWGCRGWDCDDESPCQDGLSCNDGTCGNPDDGADPGGDSPDCTWGCTGWDCSDDNPCQEGLTCTGGTCTEPGSAPGDSPDCTWGCTGWDCSDGNPCQDGLTCTGGTCTDPDDSGSPGGGSPDCTWGCTGWDCNDDNPCQDGLSCTSGTCTEPGSAPGDSPDCTWGCTGWDCSDDTPCQDGLSCTGGTCTDPDGGSPGGSDPPGDSPDCTWGCDGWDCNDNSPCQDGFSCVSSICTPDGDGDSPGNGDPPGDSPDCTWGCDGWDCNDKSPCQDGFSCVSSICTPDGDGDDPGDDPPGDSPDCTWGCDGWDCNDNTPCQDGFSCVGSICTPDEDSPGDGDDPGDDPGEDPPGDSPDCTWGCDGWDCNDKTPCQDGFSCVGGICKEDDDDDDNPRCRIKRAKQPDKTSRWLEPYTTEACRQGTTTTHITLTPSDSVGIHTTTSGVKCPSMCGQACYNYRSIMSVHSSTDDMVRFTCQQHTESYVTTAISGLTVTKFGGRPGHATDDWGSTAFGAAPADHWWPWANGFVSFSQNTAKPDKTAGCERDEFPPKYFWPGDEAARARNMKQRVRLIPHSDNKCGGRIWKGFCDQYHPFTTRTKGTDKGRVLAKTANIHTVTSTTRREVAPGSRHVTIYTTMSIQTTRGVFTIDDWDNLPNLPDHGLSLNTKCWPRDLAPNDPGWALLSDDEWYARNTQLQPEREKYKSLPPIDSLRAALSTRISGQPPWTYKKFKDSSEMSSSESSKGFSIPKSYRTGSLTLPGVPALPKRSLKMMERRDGDETSDSDLVIEWPDDVDFEDYSDEELDWWIAEYMELLAGVDDLEAPSATPAETEAVPTPAGQGEPVATPAVEKSIADAEMPEVTGGGS